MQALLVGSRCLAGPSVQTAPAMVGAYSGGGIHRPPTTTNCAEGGVLLHGVVGLGLLAVCSRYFLREVTVIIS